MYMYLARLNLPAQERYKKMIKEFPRLCNRVNLGYIASFLGITQPTLSRIRSRQNFLTQDKSRVPPISYLCRQKP